MARTKLKLDHAGIAAVLKSGDVAGAVNGAAEGVAGRLSGRKSSRGEDMPVAVRSYVTDRAAASVQLQHPAARGIEAKYGLMARAASAAGLDMNPRRS